MASYSSLPAPTRDNRGQDFASYPDYDPNPQADGSYTEDQLRRFLWDIRMEPEWRRDAQRENSYYDNDQLGMETLRRMRELGIPPVVINMVAPAIDSVAGWEAITRANLRVVPETEDSYDTAMALNVKFAEAQRLTNLNQKVGVQFKEMLKTGIGWLEVGRSPNPMKYDYVVRNVPWREMFWDYRSREPDLSDARFIVRRKWHDYDMLLRYFPDKRKELMLSMNSFRGGWIYEWEDVGPTLENVDLALSFDQQSRFTLEEDEWRQQWRGRIPLYEILYVVADDIKALRFDNGQSVELDENNPAHLTALTSGQAELRSGVTERWRQAYYAGSYRLADQPISGNMPHYIPMIAYRRDGDGAVYGLIRRMRSPQEAINARHSRMLYDLSSLKVMIDSDSVDDINVAIDEINKINSVIVRRPDRVNPNGIEIMPGTETSATTFQMLQEAKANIFDVTGLHPEFQGRTAGSSQSGVAIEQLVEQTTQVLGSVVDNYKEAKRKAGERLMAMIVDDVSRRPNLEVETDPDIEGKRRRIILNRRGADGPTDNNVLMARMRTALSDTPASATYLQQKFQSLVEIVKSMPPEMQAVMMDLIVRAAALPDSEEMLERIRELTGFGPEPRDPEKRAALQAKMQEAEEAKRRIDELEQRMAAAELAGKESKAALDAAKAAKTAGADTGMTEAQTDLAEAETAKTIAEIGELDAESARRDRETDIKGIEAGTRLRKESNAAAKQGVDKKSE